MSTVPDAMLSLLHTEGYSYGEMALDGPDGPRWYVDASKDGHRWRVIAPTRYETVFLLMDKLGWDVEERGLRRIGERSLVLEPQTRSVHRTFEHVPPARPQFLPAPGL